MNFGSGYESSSEGWKLSLRISSNQKPRSAAALLVGNSSHPRACSPVPLQPRTHRSCCHPEKRNRELANL